MTELEKDLKSYAYRLLDLDRFDESNLVKEAFLTLVNDRLTRKKLKAQRLYWKCWVRVNYFDRKLYKDAEERWFHADRKVKYAKLANQLLEKYGEMI